jgi:anti-anti-sigma factor
VRARPSTIAWSKKPGVHRIAARDLDRRGYPRGNKVLGRPSNMNDELLVVTTRQEDNVHVVRARGEVDMSTAPLLEEALSAACDTAGPHASVVVDLAAVTFFGTTGLGVLVTTLGRCQALRIPLRLIAPGPAVLRQLSAVGLDRVFDLTGSLTAAGRVA